MGAEIDGKKVNIGEELVGNLKDNDKLGWTIVSKDEAERGVEYGTYYASVYINKVFSEDLSKVIKREPQSAEILYKVNEKLNAIAPKVTSAGATTIANQISEQFIGEASKALFTEFNSIGLKLEEELPTIRRLEAKLFELEARLPEINRFGAAVIEIDSDWDIICEKANQFLEFKELIPQINEGADQILVLEKRLPQNIKLGEKILELEQEIPKIEDVSKETSKLNDHLSDVESQLDEALTGIGEERLNELIDVFPEVKERLNKLIERIEKDLPVAIKAIHDASGFVREDLPGIEDKIHEVATFIRNDLQTVEKEYARLSALLDEHMPEIEEAIHSMAKFAKLQLPEFEEKVGTIADRMRQFDKEHDLGELISLLKNDMEKESAFFSKPVYLVEEKIFPIPNYGSANAPFYTALCLWVGALLLSNLLSTNVHSMDQSEDYTVRHMYLGRIFLFLVVGILQALIVSLGKLFILDVYAAHPFLIVMVFTTIVYTLASVFGHIGKAMAVVLMVLQLSGAGGTFPIQVAPPFFQAIHPFLPFTYAINLLREAVGGIVPSITWTQIGVLVGVGVLALVFGLLLKEPLSARIIQTAEKSKSSRLME